MTRKSSTYARMSLRSAASIVRPTKMSVWLKFFAQFVRSAAGLACSSTPAPVGGQIVERSQARRQAIHQPLVGHPSFQKRGQHATFGQPAHLDRGLDRLARTADTQLPVTFHDVDGTQVQIGAQAPVEPYLCFAVRPPFLRRRGVRNAVVDWLAQFVGIRACQEYP